MKWKLLFLFFTAIMGMFVVKAQDFSTYKKVEGLNSNVVYQIMQDSKGYLWVCTDKGVSRYNGYQFKLFTIDDGLTDNDVFQIKEDSKGRLWFLTYNGKPCIYDHGKILNASNTEWLRLIQPSKLAGGFLEDKPNSVWYNTLDTAYHIINDRVVQKIAPPQDKLGKQNIHRVFIYHDTTFFICNMGIYNTLSNTIQYFDSSKTIFQSSASSIVHNDVVFYLSRNSLYSFSLKTHENKEIVFAPFAELCLLLLDIHSIDTFLISTTEHLYQFNIATKEVKLLPTKHNHSVTYLFKDKEGNEWVSSLTNGLLVKENELNKSLYKVGVDGYPSNNICHSISQVGSKLYFGFDEANYVSFSNNRFESNKLLVNHNVGKISRIFLYRQKLYSSMNQGDVYQVGENQRCINVSAKDIAVDTSKMYIATPSGLIKIKNQIKDNVYFDKDFIILSNKRVNRLLLASKDSLYVGGVNGLELWVNDKQIPFLNNKSTKGLITKIIQTPEHHIVFSTNNVGIGIICKDTVYAINKESGLLTNSIQKVCAFSPGLVWVSSSKGLNKLSYHISSDKKIHYTIEDYNWLLRENKLNIIDLLQRNDTLFLATDKGVFYYLMNRTTTYLPQVYIESFVINDSITYFSSPPNSLQYNESRCRINFIGLAFQAHGNIIYRYRLKGIDNQWKETNNTFVEYPYLAPDTYQFEVLASIPNGKWTETPAIIQFTILPPWWKSLWFVVPTILISFCITLFIIFYFVKDLKDKYLLIQQKLEQDKQIVLLEQKALQLQMNPHFIFNTINAIKGAYGAGNIANAQKYIEHFSLLMRQILQTSDVGLVSVESEIELLTNYLELNRLRTGNKFTYSISCGNLKELGTITIPSMLIQPIVENAILHGIASLPKGGVIAINFIRENQYLKCIVKDNGIGIAKANAKKTNTAKVSKAINITKQRLKLLAKNDNDIPFLMMDDIKDDNGTVLGTCVIILIPIFDN